MESLNGRWISQTAMAPAKGYEGGGGAKAKVGKLKGG
jgi:hypothetical protein